jgi:general secretion pathway protein J
MRARGAAGFTLLEIVVVLAVFGFLLVGLSQTMRFGLTAWRQDARLSGGNTDMDAVDRSLRAIIENLAPGDETGRPAITGSANLLTGLTRLRVPGSGPVPVPVEAGLAVSGTRLVLRWRPYHHWTSAGPPPPPPRETELIGGVARLGIEYWQPSGTWTSTWQEPELPLLIRLRLTFAGENAPRWPDIVAAPLLSRP